ncbi:hypothetical protein, partial [uncultured Jatrophihabitans sp.]|uniref:hypothetical protein n=1 Tax=uncultured Jatrophihabitans sp. TaxID=1610747 RepID=UPI0035CA9288
HSHCGLKTTVHFTTALSAFWRTPQPSAADCSTEASELGEMGNFGPAGSGIAWHRGWPASSVLRRGVSVGRNAAQPMEQPSLITTGTSALVHDRTGEGLLQQHRLSQRTLRRPLRRRLRPQGQQQSMRILRSAGERRCIGPWHAHICTHQVFDARPLMNGQLRRAI